MSKQTKNQTVKLNKVAVVINPDGVELPVKVDKRTSNPGRPVNKQSARYKRLAKQSYYTKQNKLFVSGKDFYLPNVISSLHYTKSVEKSQHDLGSIFNELSEHVCTVNYIGRTKVQGFKYVLGKRVSVELNLKNVKFGK